MREVSADVAPFRSEAFSNYGEFEQYLRESDALRGTRWLHERSMASPRDEVTLHGTCGLCLVPTQFTASTRGGEAAPGGRVPNWREGLVCGCERELINRERALLHYLLDAGLLQPWARVLALGSVESIRPVLAASAGRVDVWPGALTAALARGAPARAGYHVIVSVEQLDRQLAQPVVLAAIAGLLAPGGSFVFTAPFEVAQPSGRRRADGPVGWELLDDLIENGFATAKACTYWSEELGYLGAFNFIFTAAGY